MLLILKHTCQYIMFKEFSEAEQEKKTTLKRKLDESGPGKCCNEVLPY